MRPDLILMVIGLVLVIDSLVVVFFPKWSREALLKLAKDKKLLKKVVVIEMLIGAALFAIGYVLR